MAVASFAWAGAVDFVSVKADAPAEIPGSRAETLDMRFCNDLASWTTIGAVDEIKCYIYVPAEVATKYAGNEITSIVFNAYVTSAMSLNGTVFVSEDINGAPVVQKSLKILRGKSNNVGKFQSNAYTIKEGVGFYLGYTVLKPVYNPQQQVADFPIGFDEGPQNQYAGFIEYTTGASKKTLKVSESGQNANLFVYATTTGAVTEVNDVFATGDVVVGNYFTLPVCGSGEQEALLSVYNCGTNALTSVDYEYSINGSAPIATSCQVELAGQTSAYVPLPVTLPASRADLTVKVKKLNGKEFESATTSEFIAVAEGFDHQRRMVVEEFTGTWCGWCPRGIVAFEKMEKAYADQFIGIAVHSGDAMATSTYNALLNKYAEGFPGCIINRDPMYSPDPSFDNLDACMSIFDDSKAAVAPYITSLEFKEKSKPEATDTALVNAKVVFGFNDKVANYKVAFVVLEDSVLGRQTNYYAGGGNGALDGWEKMGSTVTWQYAHVARNIYSVWGLEGLLPAEVEAGQECDFTYELSFKGVKAAKRKDAHVVMLVIDSASGTILNACKVGAADDWQSGLGSVAADKAAVKVYGAAGSIEIEGEYSNVQVFTISGQQVGRTTGLAAGIYVVCVDGAAHKVSVK